MKLKQLLKDFKTKPIEPASLEREITGIAVDHRKVKKGDLFIALKGENFDGNDYVDQAIKNGAAAVLSEKLHYRQECIIVEDARKAYALSSKHFYNDVCDKLKIIAVTGTNGKTTTCNTISDILKANGKKVGVIGTLGASFEEGLIDTGMTTPDPDKLHKIFTKMYDEGKEYVVMEASAHALYLKKLEGINFEVGVLTNITEDHLDFFGDMKSYAKAKFMLFDKNRCKKAVVCKGKTFDNKFLENLGIPFVTYAVDGNDVDYGAEVIEKNFLGSKFLLNRKGFYQFAKTKLVGKYNVENALASIAVCSELGFKFDEIQKGLSSSSPVEGRFNVININGMNIIIDFAHTPDGLEKVLTTARDLTRGKLVVIFGCGGNRDKIKRPIMGKIASTLADDVVLTSDNPRFEKPEAIIEDIKKGINKKNKKLTRQLIVDIADRKQAIEFALKKYRNGETIVIAGKGGEKYQDIDGIKHPYNDFDVVNDFYRKLFLCGEKYPSYEIESEDE